MVKPSSNTLRIKSEHSVSTKSSKHKMNVPMSSCKTGNKKRKNRTKTKKNIKKLFNYLRSESNSTLDSTDTTVIVLDNSIISPACHKRTLSEPNFIPLKRQKINVNVSGDGKTALSVINVPTSGVVTPRKPSTIQCSTPINNKDSKSLQDLVLSNFGNSKSSDNTVTAHNFNSEIINLTKEINNDSYLTIDLTEETLNNTSISRTQNTVIDLVSGSENHDCSIVSVSNANLSMSGDSDVTVLNLSQNKAPNEKQMRKFAKGIAKLDASAKGKLLEMITQNILKGCDVPKKVTSARNLHKDKESLSRATETVEDTYIKEVIIGQTDSRNSIGSNIYNPERDTKNKTGLRMIVIDGSNVAMEHGRGNVFSVRGLKICIEYFLKRGHIVKAFVPRFRCKFGKSTEPSVLDSLERRGLVVYTPSREIQGRMITSYDDRYIVQCAAEFDGVIVSGDNYRDLLRENPRWRFVIENRVLPFTWVNDMIMFPKDPVGRYGPTLERFLSH